jgi:lipopolysaccharide transport system permease protein
MVLIPAVLLACYTFVFSFVFGARWGQERSTVDFALILFTGLLLFNVLADCIARGPSLIINNQTYVKRVFFPLEILPIVSTTAALVGALISAVVLLVFVVAFRGVPQPAALLLPILFLPLALFSLSASYFLSALGVYLRDLQQATGLFITVLMFLSPIFYPLASVPEHLQPMLWWNPLTWIVESGRGLIFFDRPFPLIEYLSVTSVSLFLTWLGYAFFMKTRKGFADVM